ncbi:MAG: rhodanese-like domain-containing protein [Bacteroidales bacterium]
MHLLLLFTLFVPVNLSLTPDTGSYRCVNISKDDFYSDMKLKPEIKIIDVRTKAEFRSERIENAINIPLTSLPCRKVLEINRETVIYLYCKSGVRSCWAAAKFDKMGFKHVYSLNGGIIAWKKAGLPVLTGRKGIRVPQFIPLSPYPVLAPLPHIR